MTRDTQCRVEGSEQIFLRVQQQYVMAAIHSAGLVLRPYGRADEEILSAVISKTAMSGECDILRKSEAWQCTEKRKQLNAS